MHFDVVLSVFIHPCTKKWRRDRWRWLSVCARLRCVCVCARASDLCAGKLLTQCDLLLQQSRASFMLTLCLRAVLISSPDTWDWTRMHALLVMHRRTLCENVDLSKLKVPFYRYRYFTHGIDASYRHTLYRYVDPYRWIVNSSKFFNSVIIVVKS